MWRPSAPRAVCVAAADSSAPPRGVAAIAAAIVAVVLLVPGSSPSGTRVVFASKAGVSASATLRPHAVRYRGRVPRLGAADGEYYWLWLTGADEDRIPAGTFRGTAGNE